MTTVRSQDMTLQEAVAEAVDGRSTMICCPAHGDPTPSLHVSPGTSQPVILKCHAECTAEEIVRAAGMTWADFCNPLGDDRVEVDRWMPGDLTATYVFQYRSAEGRVLFEVLRAELPGGKKSIRQRQPDPTSSRGHKWNLEGVERVLYRLPEVLAAVKAGGTIHIAEGETCAEALLKVIPDGDEATTNPMGAGKWEPAYSEALRGANVVLYADADDKGRAHMRRVREELLEVGCTVKILEAPPGTTPTGKAINDVADHLDAGRGLGEMLETTPEDMAQAARSGVDIHDLIRRPPTRRRWVIDGTLAKAERHIIIGFEGNGKSTLLRQIAAMTAAGLHWSTGLPLEEPRKVVYVDAENQPDQVQSDWAQLVGLCFEHGYPIQRGMLTVLEEHDEPRPDFVDPTGSGAAWLMERVHAYKPDLMVMGPLTNLAGKDLKDDEQVRRLRNAVDKARTVCQTAFILEHHAPLKGAYDRTRALRPYGSSLFLKWPDFGHGLEPTKDPQVFNWAEFRGKRVRSRRFPAALREGTPNTLDFPWMECEPPSSRKG